MGFKENMMLRLLIGLAALILPLSAMAQEKVLRAVLHADVRVIDPIWTTQTIANIHGALVYDTLFGNDADQKPQPQMGAKYGVGQRLMGYVTGLDAVDDKTFKMVLREPYGMVLESLGKTGSSIAAI